jgi:hypothetical protein
MPYVPYKKGTVLIPTGGTKHLFAIVTDKCPAHEHLLVNLTSVRKGVSHDPACEVGPGEHAFVKQESYVEYRRAETMAAARISARVDDGTFTTHDDLSNALLQAFRDGIEDSDHVAQRILDYFQKAKSAGR